MSNATHFPTLDGFGPTRKTLQLYARALSALARAHAPAHPNWWHISLKVTPTGLVTDNIPCAGGGILAGRMDLQHACIVLESSDGRSWTLPMDAGHSGRTMGDHILAAAAEAGIETDDVDRGRFDDNQPGTYDAAIVGRFHTALIRADRTFKRHGARLGEKAGPVRLWPHGFDLAMEWFGSRRVVYNEGEGVMDLPAQLNLGFYPGEDDASSYFYSNPWPFEAEKLLHHTLPEGAVWHTNGWKGTLLSYTKAHSEDQILRYAQGVFEIASPLLNQ